MEIKKENKKLFVINILLVGIIIGFVASIFINKNYSIVKTVEAGKTDLVDMQFTFREVAKEVLPEVVEIRVVEIKEQEMPKGYSWPFNFIEPEEGSEEHPEKRKYESEGLGSGVIVKHDNDKYYVLTNNHVIGEADKITVKLNDKTEIPAQIIGTDDRKDLALIAFATEKEISVAKIGDSDKLYVGDWVLAVGSPLGYDSTVTAGIVSSIGRNGPESNINDFIQTDAAINQGNSGGALVNLDGELVGINTWIATTTGESIGLGFSIPINNVKQAVDDFIENGSVKYGWLGVSISDPDKTIKEDLGLTDYTGALINNVYDNSPAFKAGIQAGDYIIKVDGVKIKDYKHFMRQIGDLRAGEKIKLTYIRFGKEEESVAEIELRQDNSEISSQHNKLWPGISIYALNDAIKEELKLNNDFKGVLISVDFGTIAYSSGLKDYDIITAINGKEINNMMDFYQIINDKQNKYTFSVLRNNQMIELVLEKGK